MNVTIVTPCRDAERALPDYRLCVEALVHPREALRVVVVEGDSVDRTWARLWEWAAQDSRVTVVKCDTGRPRYGSVVHAERFATLAQVFNTGLDAVDTVWSDYVLFVPVDIRFGPDLLQRLIAHGVDLVSPITWQGDIFYDTWALSVDGRFYGNFARSQAREFFPDGLTRATTIGGTMLMRGEVIARGVRYRAEDVDRGLCAQATALGYGLWFDPTTEVEHVYA